MTHPSPQRPRGRHIPQEDLLVPTNACEARVVLGDGDVQDFIPVRGVRLNQSGSGRGEGGFSRVVEAYETVGGAGQELGGMMLERGERLDGGGIGVVRIVLGRSCSGHNGLLLWDD